MRCWPSPTSKALFPPWSALARYRGCRHIVVAGSNHGVSDFARYVDPVLAYAGVAVVLVGVIVMFGDSLAASLAGFSAIF